MRFLSNCSSAEIADELYLGLPSELNVSQYLIVIQVHQWISLLILMYLSFGGNDFSWNNQYGHALLV